MKNLHLLSCLTYTTVALSTISIGSKPAIASDATFHCQSNQETPATVAKTSNGAEQSVFHWKLDAQSISSSPEELCNSVTEKLNKYIAEGNDLSSFTFKASTLFGDDEAMNSLPAICVASQVEPCKLLLFTLNPSDNPKAGGDALDLILDPALRSTAVKPSDRGVQSTSYQVNFWDLLGL